MKAKVSDWRKENYKLGDKLYMTTFSYYGKEKGQNVYISHIGKTVLKVKPDLNKDYEITFKKGYSKQSNLGLCYSLFDSEESYEDLKSIIKHREDMIVKLKQIANKIPNEEIEELLIKYGDNE